VPTMRRTSTKRQSLWPARRAARVDGRLRLASTRQEDCCRTRGSGDGSVDFPALSGSGLDPSLGPRPRSQERPQEAPNPQRWPDPGHSVRCRLSHAAPAKPVLHR
jgi:hypothetical protein